MGYGSAAVTLALGAVIGGWLVGAILRQAHIPAGPLTIKALVTPTYITPGGQSYSEEVITITLTAPAQTKLVAFESDIAAIQIPYEKYIRYLDQQIKQYSYDASYQSSLESKKAAIEAYMADHDTWQLDDARASSFVEEMLYAGEAAVYDKKQQGYVTLIFARRYVRYRSPSTPTSDYAGAGGSDFFLLDGSKFFQTYWIT